MASSLIRSLVNTRSKKHFEYNVLSIGNVYFGDRCWKAKNHLIVFAINSKIYDRREGVRCAPYYQTRHMLVKYPLEHIERGLTNQLVAIKVDE